MTENNNLIVNKSKALIGRIQVPGDKSISHRSIILGSITEGSLSIRNFLHCDDCLNTISAMRQLGVNITVEKQEITISFHSCGHRQQIDSIFVNRLQYNQMKKYEDLQSSID